MQKQGEGWVIFWFLKTVDKLESLVAVSISLDEETLIGWEIAWLWFVDIIKFCTLTVYEIELYISTTPVSTVFVFFIDY